MGALVGISGILLFSAHYWSVSVASLKNVLPAEVDMRLDRLVLNQAGDSGRSMVIDADSAHYYKTRDLFVLRRVRARVLTDQSDYRIEADAGQYEEGLGTAHLTGSIKVVTTEGGVLTCEALTLKFKEDLLTSEGPFCYSTPTGDLEGASFVFHTRDKRLTVDGRARLLLE
jgi:LPS export ABC transporter protein LptC